MDRAAIAISISSLISGFSLITSRNLVRMLPMLQCTLANQLLASAIYALYVWATMDTSHTRLDRHRRSLSGPAGPTQDAQLEGNDSGTRSDMEEAATVGEATLWVELGRALVLSHLGCKWALFLWKLSIRMADLCVLMVLALHTLRLRSALRTATVSRWRRSVVHTQSSSSYGKSLERWERAAGPSSSSSCSRPEPPAQLTLERFSLGRCRIIALTLIALMILVSASWYYVWAFVPVPLEPPIRVGSDALTIYTSCGPPNDLEYAITHRLVEPALVALLSLVILSMLVFCWVLYLRNRAFLSGTMLIETSSVNPLTAGSDSKPPSATPTAGPEISRPTQKRSSKSVTGRFVRPKRRRNNCSITTSSDSIDMESGKVSKGTGSGEPDTSAGAPESSILAAQQVSVVIENDSSSQSLAGGTVAAAPAICNVSASPAAGAPVIVGAQNAQSKCSIGSRKQLDFRFDSDGRRETNTSLGSRLLSLSFVRPHSRRSSSTSTSNPLRDRAANDRHAASAFFSRRLSRLLGGTRVSYTVLAMNVSLTLLALCPLFALPSAVHRLTHFSWPPPESGSGSWPLEPEVKGADGGVEPLALWPGRRLAPPALIARLPHKAPVPSAASDWSHLPPSTFSSTVTSIEYRSIGASSADSGSDLDAAIAASAVDVSGGISISGGSGGQSADGARELITAIADLRFPFALLVLAIDELILILISAARRRRS